MFFKKSKKGIVLSKVIVLAVLVFFATVITLGPAKDIRDASKSITDDLVVDANLERDNLYEFIQPYIRNNDYEKVLAYIRLYFERFDTPDNEMMHSAYYIKLMALTELHKYDEAFNLALRYGRTYPDVVERFDSSQNDVTRVFFGVIAIISNEGNADEHNIDDNLFEQYNYLFSNQKWNELSGDLLWPEMLSNIRDYPGGKAINPLFMHWYRYLNLASRDGCDIELIEKTFNQIYECSKGNSPCENVRYEKARSFFNFVREKFCNNEFITAGVKAIDNDMKMSPFPYQSIADKESLFSNFPLKIPYLSREYNHLRRFKTTRYLLSFSIDYMLIRRLDSNLDSHSDFNLDSDFWILHYKGILYFEYANMLLAHRCQDNDGQVGNLSHMFNLDGNVNDLKQSLRESHAWGILNGPAVRRSNRRLGDCFRGSRGDEIKRYYRQAFESFENAYSLADSDDEDKMKIYDIVDGIWDYRNITSPEAEKAKAFIYPYYLQASFVNEVLSDNFDFTETRRILNEEVEDTAIRNDNPFNYNFQTEGFDFYFQRVFYGYVCSNSRTGFDFSDNYYFICYESLQPNQGFTISYMKSRMAAKIN